jgi:hypothetical protein
MNSVSRPSPFEEEVENEEWKHGVESGKLPDSDHATHGVSYQEALQVRVLRLAQRVLKTKRKCDKETNSSALIQAPLGKYKSFTF